MDWMTELHDSMALSHPELKNSGFAHVANVGGLCVDASYELADGLQIRKASQKEADTLRSLVYVTRPSSLMSPRIRNPYETKAHSVEPEPGHILYSNTDLPEEEWRYHVIACQGTNSKLHDFIEASVLTRCRLELGPEVFATPGSRGPGFMGGGYPFGCLCDQLDRTDEPFLTLGLPELDDLRLVYERVSALEDDRVGLRPAMKRMTQLDHIPKGSPLRFLGYISVLESLITHAPDPKDPYDSLTRQVSRKMLLVGRRSVIPIPYKIFGADVTEEKFKTLWTRLYGYRSAIAHGETPDFAQRFQCLRDPATALEFISCATVALMRQALEETDLIADLHDC